TIISEEKPLSVLAAGVMHRVPQVLENVKLSERIPLEEMTTLAAASSKVEKALGDTGRVLIRWSGTEPKLRIMLEGEDEAKVRQYVSDLVVAAEKDAKARRGPVAVPVSAANGVAVNDAPMRSTPRRSSGG